MTRWIVAAFLLLALFVHALPTLAVAQDAADGVIQGQVVNGTEGGGSVAGVRITLYNSIDDALEGEQTTTADGQGGFEFAGVPTEHEYMISANYMDVDYYYSVGFESGNTSAVVEVPVCDATASDDAIRVMLAHTIIRVEEDSLEVTEVVLLTNDGEKSYVGTNGVLVFTLPQGATDFGSTGELMQDFEFLDSSRVTYAVPFPPGERQLVYSYRLPRTAPGESIIPLEIAYPTDSLEVMVGGDDIEVSSTQLAPAEPIETEDGERYIHLWGENLARGTVLNLSVRSVAGGFGAGYVVLWVVVAAVVAAIALGVTRQTRRGREHTDESE